MSCGTGKRAMHGQEAGDEGEDGGEAAMDEGGRDTRRRRLWRMALDGVAEAVAWRHASAKDVGMDEALQARQEEATTARMEAKSETAAERRRRFMRRPKHGAWLRATWAERRASLS